MNIGSFICGERVFGGVLYESALESEIVDTAAQKIQNLHANLGKIAFYTPVFKRFADSPETPMPLIDKAWLTLADDKALHAGRATLASLVGYDNATEDVHYLMELADELDRCFLRPSSDRCIQIYQPSAMMFPHTDEETSVRLVNLAGTADVQWHDPDTQFVVDKTRLNPGDILHLEGSNLHSVRNAGTDTRIVLGLIDD